MNTEKSCAEFLQNESSRQNRGALIMAASVLCFTINTLLLKYLGTSRTVSPAVALLFRATVGSVIVVAFFRSRQPLEIKPIFRDRALICRGITGIIGTAAYYLTVPTLGAGKATLLCNTYVLFAVIIAALVIGESIRKSTFAWVAVAFAGIALLIAQVSGTSRLVRPPGVDEAIGLIGALGAASTVVLIRRLTLRYSNGTIFMTQCLWVGIAALPFAVFSLPEITVFDAVFLTGAAAMAACGQLLLNEGYRRLSVASGSSIQMGWPLLTAAGGFLFFGEVFTPLQFAGAGLILLGIFKVTVR